jgi:hypothetical protein
MTDTYKTPLARAAKFMEIIIPAYMFGKAWGIALDARAVALFRAEFPAFLIDTAEAIKAALHTENESLMRFFATTAGFAVGLLVILVLALVMHLVLRDRKYMDSLRFASVSLVPLAVLNGTLSHGMQTLLHSLDENATESQLHNAAVNAPNGQILIFTVFYLFAIFMLARRTGVRRAKRWVLVGVGVLFMVVYLAAGLTITGAEWDILYPQLQQLSTAGH